MHMPSHGMKLMINIKLLQEADSSIFRIKHHAQIRIIKHMPSAQKFF